MGPDAAVGQANFGLRLRLEASVLFPTGWRSFNERDCAAAFFKAVEHSIGIGDSAFVEGAMIPNFFAGFEILAGPTGVRVAVNMIAYENNAAMMNGIP